MAIYPGEATILHYSTDGGAYYNPVGNVISIDPPEWSVASVKRPVLAGETTFRPSLFSEVGEMSGSVYFDFDDSSHQDIVELMEDPAVIDWRIEFNDASGTATGHYDFKGFLTKFKVNGAQEATDVTADFSIQMAELPTVEAV